MAQVISGGGGGGCTPVWVCASIGNIADRKILKDLCSTPLHVALLALQHHYYTGLQIYRLIAHPRVF